MPSAEITSKRQAAREVIDILSEISLLLVRVPAGSAPNILMYKTTQNTHLDRSTLSLCVSLIENGVNPEALAVSIWSRGCGVMD